MTARPLIHRSPIPGLGISAGITITLLSLVVLLPSCRINWRSELDR